VAGIALSIAAFLSALEHSVHVRWGISMMTMSLSHAFVL
jgi:hypothetical protein